MLVIFYAYQTPEKVLSSFSRSIPNTRKLDGFLENIFSKNDIFSRKHL